MIAGRPRWDDRFSVEAHIGAVFIALRSHR